LQGDTRLGQGGLGGLGRILATDLERLLAVHGLAQRVLTHAVAQLERALRDQRPADQALQHLVLQLAAQFRGNVRAAQALLPLRLLAQPCVCAPPRGRSCCRPPRRRNWTRETQIHDAIGAPGGKHQRERAQHQVREPFLALQAVSDPLKHV